MISTGGKTRPTPLLGTDLFSVRWTGFVEPERSEVYMFYILSDDGVRLWVDGQELVDDWQAHSLKESSDTISLQAGQQYAVVPEYFDNTRAAAVSLSWSSPSLPEQVIPEARLSHSIAGD